MWKFFRTLKQAVSEFINDGCMSSGAAIAYYAVFALPPLAMMVYLSLGYAGVSRERINATIKQRLGLPTAAVQTSNTQSTGGDQADGKSGDQADGNTGDQGGLGTLAQRAQSKRAAGISTIGGIIGAVILLFTATGLFGELQLALNRAWGVKPDPEQGGVRRFLLKRAFSLGLILIMVVLLLMSMLLSTLLDEIYSYVQGAVPGGIERAVSTVLDNVVTFIVGTLLFAAVFKLLPDVEIRWRNMWVGAAFTAVLFIIGKALIAWYLGRSNLGESWGGTTASMIAVLAWFYYTSLILLFGAEFTQVWAREYGTGFGPSAGARDTGKRDDQYEQGRQPQ